jgi:hypothetical protein
VTNPSTFSYDPDTDRGKVRLLIQDTDTSSRESQFFTDGEIDAFLAMESGVLTAAALALETMASQQVMVLKVIRLLDLSTDGAAVSRELRERAKSLRELSLTTGDDADAFDWAEMVVDDWSWEERLYGEALRGG